MSVLHAFKTSTTFHLSLLIETLGEGGVAGATPTVGIRESDTDDLYLDWDDMTFKTSGWGTQYAAMEDHGNGYYRRLLNFSAITNLTTDPTKMLVAEYTAPAHGVAQDLIQMNPVMLEEIRDGVIGTGFIDVASDPNGWQELRYQRGTNTVVARFELYDQDSVRITQQRNPLNTPGILISERRWIGDT